MTEPVVARDAGECVWVREHEFTFRGIRYCQRELFFLGRTEPFRIHTSQMEEIELEIVLSHRWWDLDDIEATTGVVFAPRLLGRYLRRLIDGVIPKEPIDVGV